MGYAFAKRQSAASEHDSQADGVTEAQQRLFEALDALEARVMTMGQRQSSQANDDAAHRQLLGEHEELSAQHQLLAEEHRKQGQLLLDVQQDYIKTREGARTILSVLDATIDGLEKSVA